MPLSEHEQRMLDQIERGLYAEDPKFASNVRGARMRNPSRRRKLQGAVVFVVGAVLLVVGVIVANAAIAGYIIAVAGFLLMFAGVVVALFTRSSPAAADGAGKSTSTAKGGFAQRMEERLRRRFEDR